jgi:hypothetical protein
MLLEKLLTVLRLWSCGMWCHALWHVFGRNLLHHSSTLKMEAPDFSKILVPIRLHSAISQKTAILILTAVLCEHPCDFQVKWRIYWTDTNQNKCEVLMALTMRNIPWVVTLHSLTSHKTDSTVRSQQLFNADRD